MVPLCRIAIASLTLILAAATASSHAAQKPSPGARKQSVVEGFASYYAESLHGKPTASGVPFDMNAMMAAHPTFPFGTVVRVTNLANGRWVRLRILDRGPAAGPQSEGVVIDVSTRAAKALGLIEKGRARVRVEVLEWGK
jgi:rare lipoprotein A